MRIEDRFGDWSGLLKPTLDSEYMKQLGLFINQQYKKKLAYPSKENIFRAFTECKYSDLKVVIIGSNPYQNNKGTGLAFGNKVEDTIASPELLKIWQALEFDMNERLILDFDTTLESWANQGVLLLNKSLTVNKYRASAHSIYWEKFTKELLIALSKSNERIIYCLWGSEARKMSKYIDSQKNYILYSTSPSYAISNNEVWKCDNFSSINQLLKTNKYEPIKWY
jgi:uracil-DNA glycosylase